MTRSDVDRSLSRLRRLVDRHPDNREGQDLTGEAPLRVHAGHGAPRRVLVTTNQPTLQRWNRTEWPPGLVAVAPLGLPSRAQCRIIGALAPARASRIAFVGDADPMSLHAYACLRAHLGTRVRFAGICDPVLHLLGEPRASPEALERLALSPLDRAHLRLVERLIDLEQVLGPRVAGVLRGGSKIELEALSFRASVLIPALFRAALRRMAPVKRGA